MSKFTVLGDGTLTIGSAPSNFSGEVVGAKVTHAYEDVGSARTMLDGAPRPAGQRRTDGLTANIENDLTAAGMYAFLFANDGTAQPFEFVPNDDDGAGWTGVVKLRLPGEVGADEYGSPIVSEVQLPGVGRFAFTPATEVAP